MANTSRANSSEALTGAFRRSNRQQVSALAVAVLSPLNHIYGAGVTSKRPRQSFGFHRDGKDLRAQPVATWEAARRIFQINRQRGLDMCIRQLRLRISSGGYLYHGALSAD